MMESQAATIRRTVDKDENRDGDQNQRTGWSGSRDLSPIIRHDFVSSPWKRFRPSTDDVGRQPRIRRRPASTSSRRNFGNFVDTDAARTSTVAVQSKDSSHPLMVRARCPGFTTTVDTASRSQHHLHLQPNTSSSTDSQDPTFTRSLHHIDPRRLLDVRPRFPGFTVKADSRRFDLASSTGEQALSLLVICNCCRRRLRYHV